MGINDGLVTNISLILGVVGANATPAVVQLAGLASLIADAGSMAVGEYISMRAQVELLELLLAEGREAIRTDPERERVPVQVPIAARERDEVGLGHDRGRDGRVPRQSLEAKDEAHLLGKGRAVVVMKDEVRHLALQEGLGVEPALDKLALHLAAGASRKVSWETKRMSFGSCMRKDRRGRLA